MKADQPVGSDANSGGRIGAEVFIDQNRGVAHGFHQTRVGDIGPARPHEQRFYFGEQPLVIRLSSQPDPAIACGNVRRSVE
jgi:hypothetical protein